MHACSAGGEAPSVADLFVYLDMAPQEYSSSPVLGPSEAKLFMLRLQRDQEQHLPEATMEIMHAGIDLEWVACMQCGSMKACNVCCLDDLMSADQC